MTEVINVFRTVIAVILSVFTSFFAVGITAPQNAAPEEDVTLSAAILSDTHITKELYRKVLFTPGLKNISKLSPDLFILIRTRSSSSATAPTTATKRTGRLFRISLTNT